MVHLKGYMYKWIMEDLGKTLLTSLYPVSTLLHSKYFVLFLCTDEFILSGKDTEAVLNRLVGHGKKLFLITNSPFGFV